MAAERDRGLSVCRSAREQIHLFGSYGNPNEPASWPSFTKEIPTTWGTRGEGQRLWLVSGRGRSLQRYDAAAPLGPLFPEYDDGLSFSPRPLAKLAIRVSNMAIDRQPLLIDADQSIEVYASEIGVSPYVPMAVQNVWAPSRPLEVSAGELGVDDVVGCRILGIQTPVGHRDATLTTYLFVGDGVPGSTQVPRGAVSLTVYAAERVTLSWRAGDPLELPATANLGTWTADESSVAVPSASHLAVEPPVNGDQFLTLVWTIRA